MLSVILMLPFAILVADHIVRSHARIARLQQELDWQRDISARYLAELANDLKEYRS